MVSMAAGQVSMRSDDSSTKKGKVDTLIAIELLSRVFLKLCLISYSEFTRPHYFSDLSCPAPPLSVPWRTGGVIFLYKYMY